MNNEIVQGFDDLKDDRLTMRLQRIPDTEGGLVIYASGYIDSYNLNGFERAIKKAIAAGYFRLIFQMRAVNYLASAPMGALTSMLKTLRSRNGDMVLDQVQPTVYEIFKLLGFSQFFNFTDGLEEACAHFVKQRPPSFPSRFRCPICSKLLQAARSGRFRCRECRTILVIDETTSVTLGSEETRSGR